MQGRCARLFIFYDLSQRLIKSLSERQRFVNMEPREPLTYASSCLLIRWCLLVIFHLRDKIMPCLESFWNPSDRSDQTSTMDNAHPSGRLRQLLIYSLRAISEGAGFVKDGCFYNHFLPPTRWRSRFSGTLHFTHRLKRIQILALRSETTPRGRRETRQSRAQKDSVIAFRHD